MAYELATAVQNLRDQMELESRMGKAAQWAKGIESRVTALELHLTGDEAITETQAADLALAVKTWPTYWKPKAPQTATGASMVSSTVVTASPAIKPFLAYASIA